jgi:osmotically-inducible protein OsmY
MLFGMRFLFVLVLGIAIGAAAYYYYERRPQTAQERAVAFADSARDSAQRAADKARVAAHNFSGDFAGKLKEWHLTSDDIRADLAKTGVVVRENAARAKVKVADARIVASIKAKYVLEKDISASAITVDCTEGDVMLTGTVASEDLIGKAVALALDTDGVQHVKAQLKVAR